MTTSATIGASGVSYIDALLSGVKWGGGALTIHFATSSASLGYALGDNSAFAALSGLEVTAFKSILARWAEVSGLTFTEVADPAQADLSIYWYRAADNPTARAFGPGNTALAGDIQLGSGISGTDLTQAGSYSYFMALQQIAVALGLKDPGAAAAGFPEDDAMAVPESVLSSVSYEGGSSAAYTIGAGSYPAMPMLNDIAAIQHLYGVNTNALTGSIGDTTYTFDPSAAVIFRVLWDGGGFDTINFASYSVGLSLDLRPDHWSNLGGQYATLDAGDAAVKPPGNIVLPYLHNGGGYRIEAAYGGSGDDLIQGNDVDNLLRGNGGNDTLRGGGGVDTLVGGAGSDAFDVSEGLAGAVQISDFVAGDRIILPFAPSGGISRSDGAALTAGQVSISFNGFYSVLNVGLDATPGYDLRIVLANSTVFDNLNLSGDTITYQADTVAPTLTAVSGPADNAVKVPLDATPTLHFSERLLPGTGSFQVYNVTDGAVVQTIAVGSGAVSGWGTEQLTLQLAALPEGKIIAIRWDAGVVTDLSGNALAAGNSGDTLYSFTTNIRPTASASAGDLNVAAAGGSSYSFTVTYSDADGTIDGATIGLDDVTVTAPDASTLTVTGFTWNAGARTATYTVAAPGGTWSAAADGVYRIGLVGGAVRDDTGDAVAAVGALAEFEVDMTPPAMPTVALAEDTGRLNNDRITSNGEIMVSGLEPGATFQFSTDSGGQWTTGGGTSFTLPAGSYGAGVVRVRQVDAAGNEGPAWNLAAVTVDATAPRVLSVERDTPTGELTNADIISFRVTFDEEVYGLASGVTLTGTTATLSGSSANGLTYVFTFSGGDLANLNGVVGLSFSGPFADAAGNALTTTVVGADQSYTLDNRAPQLSSATVQGATLTLTFDEAMQAASAAGVTVTAGGGQVAVNGVSVSGAAVVLTLAAPVAAGAAVSLQYDGASGVVLDLAGNAIGITSVAVQNLTAAPEPEAPPPPPPITGSAGDDVVFLVGGGATFSAGDGADVVTGGGGDDWIHGNMGEGTIRGGLGNDIVHGGQGRDALYGDDGDDVLFGDRGDDFVHGGRGDDVIDGGDGADILAGGQGNDVLRGGDGGDVLAGDRGDDTLVGGAGADLFRFAPGGGADIITDFSVAEGDVLLVEGPYTLFQRGADVVVDLGDGGTVTVQNAQLAWLPAGWILS